MPVMTDRQSVAANTTVPNALSGKLYEFLPFDALVRVYATASAVGMNMTHQSGPLVQVPDQEVNAQNRMPLVPDDLMCEYTAAAGTRLVHAYRNTTAGALTAFLRVEVIPLR